MAIVNRDLDSSEQLYVVQGTLGALATGVSAWVGTVPSAGQVVAVQLSAKGLSGAPVYSPAVSRWTSAGKTGIAFGSNITVAGAFGLSGGLQGVSFAANGTLTAVQAGDLLVLNTSGADTAATDVVVSFVIKAVQDYKTSYGMS